MAISEASSTPPCRSTLVGGIGPFVPNYTPLERVPVGRPVDRIRFIKAICATKRVLDLGALDETAVATKQGQGAGTWLHEEIASVATSVLGVDASNQLLPTGRLVTGKNSEIQYGDVFQMESLLSAAGFHPEVVVAGELIEHLPNPLEFLASLKRNPALSGATLVLSTPNASALHNAIVGLAGRESTHRDHLCILSYKTLTTLMIRAGFADWEITPYFARFTEMQARVDPVVRPVVAGCEAVINAVEWIAPLLSFGMVVKATI